MNIISHLTKVLILILLPLSAYGETLFDGYYKLTIASVPIGFFIQRYELDAKDKVFTSTYYYYTKTADGITVESLNAKATSKLEPLSYQYTSLEGKKSKVIDAIVKKNKLVLRIVENGKTQAREVPIKPDSFFSTFLSHLMMRNQKGIQVGNKFEYDAIAEEDGTVVKGEAYVKEQVKEKGLDSFRILNTFKKQEFINWINIKGEGLKTHLPTINLTAELMADPKEAYKNMDFNQSTIKLLFGSIPEGRTNMLNKK